MKYIEPTNFEEIIHYIEQTFSRVRSGELTITDGASNIVGATLANGRVDIHALYTIHPRLEELVELCADTETYDDANKYLNDPDLPRDINDQWADIQSRFKALQTQS